MKKIESQMRESEVQVQKRFQPQKSAFTSVVLREEREKREEAQRLKEQKRQVLENRKRYGDIVKEVFRPRPRESVNHSQDEIPVLPPILQSKKVRYVLKRRMPDAAQPPAKKHSHQQHQQMILENQSIKSDNYSQRRVMQSRDMLAAQQAEERNGAIDYLQQLRRMREQRERQGQGAPNEGGWKKIIAHDLPPEEKFEKIYKSAQRIQNRAFMKEITSKNIYDLEAANDLYVDSIKAKLSLFDEY